MTDPATTCVTQKEANLDDFVHVFSLLYKVRGVKPCVVLIRASMPVPASIKPEYSTISQNQTMLSSSIF